METGAYHQKEPTMTRLLENRPAIITGAAQGLGRALAERLLREGARVVIADVQTATLERTAAELSATGDVRSKTCDVSDEDQVRDLCALGEAEFGPCGIFVANAGILIADSIINFDVARWRKVIEVNLVGQMLCMKHALPSMVRGGGGAFIQINSKSGKKGSFKNSAYAASKFGGIGLVQSAALEMAEHGVRVNAVCPGNLLDSPLWKDSLFKQYARNQGISEAEVRQKYIQQVPMRRACTYEDVCNLVVFLASDQSSYMTGQAINVTGGQEMR